MSRTRTRWYLLGLVLILAVAAVVLSVALRSNRVVAGSAAPASGESTTAPTTPPTDSSAPSSPASTDASTPPPNIAPDGIIGAESAGDPYYPESGNAGYDVASYQVSLSFEPAKRLLVATTTIVATATAPGKLGRFSFDLQPTMQVSTVTVDGAMAGHTQHDAKLVITPTAGIATGRSMTVVVSYSGKPGPIAGGVAGLSDGGWYTTRGGGAAALGEPFSASAWYPANEHPTDRAAFSVIAEVPSEWKVISNGLPIAADLPSAPAGYATFGWSEKSEMATYLTTIYIEKFTMTQDSSGGIPVINAYGPGATDYQQIGDKTAEYIDFLASKFGPYPFDAAGGIYLADPLGFALESQTRPIYAGFANESVVVHELAHQWFGDDVSLHRWADVCLNECFASYAEWLWAENNGETLDDTYRAQIDQNKDQAGFWKVPLIDMGAGNEFGVVYVRGPLAMHALRAELGDEKFSELMLSWVEEHTGKSASWADFAQLVSQLAGKDESAFLNAWFVQTGVPADQYLYPGKLHP